MVLSLASFETDQEVTNYSSYPSENVISIVCYIIVSNHFFKQEKNIRHTTMVPEDSDNALAYYWTEHYLGFILEII
jgi:hypothetical protein